MRRIDSNKEIFLEKTNLNLSKISAIKVSPSEIKSLIGSADEDAMKLLQKSGIEYVLFTNKRDISMLVKDRIYSITLPTKDLYDTTGVGDIFSATFCSTMLKENDFLWAFSFAGGAAQAALESKKGKKGDKGEEKSVKAEVRVILKDEQAMKTIKGAKVITVQELARQTGVKISTANAYLKKLLETGTVKRVGGHSGHHVYQPVFA